MGRFRKSRDGKVNDSALVLDLDFCVLGFDALKDTIQVLAASSVCCENTLSKEYKKLNIGVAQQSYTEIGFKSIT